MNFTQIHERLRLELLRRIQRGTLSVSLLARQSGSSQSHLSLFLSNKRGLSLGRLDRILDAQQLSVSDLLPDAQQAGSLGVEGEASNVPIVSHTAALFEPLIKFVTPQDMLRVPSALLQSLRPHAASPRRAWHRFVAVRVEAGDAPAMAPLVVEGAVVLLDRHYITFLRYRQRRPNLYALKYENRLLLRYVEPFAGQLVLRPHNIDVPVDLIEANPGADPKDVIVGRVALIVNEP
jgi:transcriptional regulator with XRE-family HTH domain